MFNIVKSRDEIKKGFIGIYIITATIGMTAVGTASKASVSAYWTSDRTKYTYWNTKLTMKQRNKNP